MYFVDRQKIEDKCNFLDKQIHLFTQIDNLNDQFQKVALERVSHLMIDSVLDVGNALIDGFIMRDPGSYEDIIDILLDEKVITNEMAEQFKAVIVFRKDLVQYYTNVNHEAVFHSVTKNLEAFRHFPNKVREYLVKENELNPVNAFKNEE